MDLMLNCSLSSTGRASDEAEPVSPIAMDWFLPEEAEEAASVLLPRLREERRIDKLVKLILEADELAWEVPGISTEVSVATERLKQLVEAEQSSSQVSSGVAAPVQGVVVRRPSLQTVRCLHPGLAFLHS